MDFEIEDLGMIYHERETVIQKTNNQKFLQRLAMYCSDVEIDYTDFDTSIINYKENIEDLSEDEYIRIARDYNNGKYLYKNRHIFLDGNCFKAHFHDGSV